MKVDNRQVGKVIRAIIAFSVIMACAASSRAESTQKAIAVIHCNYAPVTFIDKNSGQPSGFGVDIMNSTAKRAGLELSYICKYGWPEMMTAVQTGEADISVLLKSAERETILLFSSPIEVTYLSYFVRSQSRVNPDIAPKGYTVGVIKGSRSYEHLKNALGVKLTIEGTYQEGIFSLLAGEIDIFAGEESLIRKNAKETNLEDRIKKIGSPFAEQERCLVVRRNNELLQERLNSALKGFIGSPDYETIYLKWYGAPPQYWSVDRILTASGLFLFVVICGMAYWRYKSIVRINRELVRTIDERKRAEEGLRESEDKFRSIVEQASDGIMIADPETRRHIEANRSICLMLGYTREEIVGMSVDDIHPKEELPAIHALFERQRRGEISLVPEIPMLRKDGSVFYADISATPVTLGRKQCLAGIFRDITERRKADDQLHRSLKEKNVMLMEIHHRVKNNMQVIYSLLNLQAKSLTDSTVRAMLEESRDRVLSMSLIHETLYRSEDLAHVEFKGYLERLIQGIASTYKRHEVRVSVDMENIALDVNIGIPCGLIANELVSNSLKHAFPDGRAGTIRIGINKNSEGNNVLFVSDNGVGFPEAVDFRNTTTLGMQLVIVLSGQINGTVALSRVEGTTFSITFPGKEKR